MAPLAFLLPREEPSPSGPGLSNIAIAGIVVISVAAFGLAVLLVLLFIRRRQRCDTEDDAGGLEKARRIMELQPYIEKEPLPASVLCLKASSCILTGPRPAIFKPSNPRAA